MQGTTKHLYLHWAKIAPISQGKQDKTSSKNTEEPQTIKQQGEVHRDQNGGGGASMRA